MTDHTLIVQELTTGYGERLVLDGLDLEIPSGKVTAIVGANACGKSTLLRTMSRLLAPRHGQVLLDGKSIHTLPSRQLAQTLGLLPQSPIAPEGILVADLVSRGRNPYHGVFSQWTRADDEAIAAALEATTFLDISHQVEVLDLLTDLNRERGTTIVMVLHDLNLAARYADFLVAMANGRLHVSGAPELVLTEQNIREVFHLESRIMTDPTSGRPIMLPLGRHRLRQDRPEPRLEPSQG